MSRIGALVSEGRCGTDLNECGSNPCKVPPRSLSRCSNRGHLLSTGSSAVTAPSRALPTFIPPTPSSARRLSARGRRFLERRGLPRLDDLALLAGAVRGGVARARRRPLPVRLWCGLRRRELRDRRRRVRGPPRDPRPYKDPLPLLDRTMGFPYESPLDPGLRVWAPSAGARVSPARTARHAPSPGTGQPSGRARPATSR